MHSYLYAWRLRYIFHDYLRQEYVGNNLFFLEIDILLAIASVSMTSGSLVIEQIIDH